MNLQRNYNVEIGPIAGATKKYLVGDISQLRDAPIMGVEFYSNTDVTKTYSGQDMMADADLIKGWLVLYFNGGEYLTLPLSQLVKVHNNVLAGHPYVDFLDQLTGQVIDWSKSYVWFGEQPTQLGRTISFNVYYQAPKI